MASYKFHVVVFEDRGWWVAQCLERNLAASSKTDPRELPAKLARVLQGQIAADRDRGVEPFSTLPQAPRRFWTLFQNAKPWGLDDSSMEFPVGAPAWTELAVA